MVRYIKEGIDFDKDFGDLDFGDNDAGWMVDVPKECIKGASLLSENEFEKYEDKIPQFDKAWWIYAPFVSDNSYALYVSSYGRVCEIGYSDEMFYARPVLKLNLQHSDLCVGDAIEFGNHTFVILSNDLAICRDTIGMYCFRLNYRAPDASNYENSDIKRYIDKWFEKSYNEYKRG